MNKTELVAALAEKSGVTKAVAERVLSAFTETVTEEMKKGDKVQLIGFGTFEAPISAARTSRNPATGATIDVPAKRKPKFSAGKPLKEAVL